ncbi:MAG: hypothetical protein Q9168_000559 [Polycauliona sp. 1 TL-2023]
MTSYAILDQYEEDSFHKSRLLNVEEKPFKRITKRLLAPTSLVAVPPTLPPTPPPDTSAADEAAAAQQIQKQQQLDSHRQWREDALLDFAAFESSIIRIQFLLTSNIRERERYAAEKVKIQATAQAVRDNTSELRVQLVEAQGKLALRKEYDQLADKITSNRLLRPRAEQHANLEKLNGEIAELERESQEYAQTWSERREQFGKIIEEGMQLRRLIRDEKEEVERREGMEDDGEEGDMTSQSESSPKLTSVSHFNTFSPLSYTLEPPTLVKQGLGCTQLLGTRDECTSRFHGMLTFAAGGRSSGVETPRPEAEGATPIHREQNHGMESMEDNLQVGTPYNLGEKSPLRSEHSTDEMERRPRVPEIEIEDTNMKEEGEVSAGPDKTFEGLARDSDREEMDVS